MKFNEYDKLLEFSRRACYATLGLALGEKAFRAIPTKVGIAAFNAQDPDQIREFALNWAIKFADEEC